MAEETRTDFPFRFKISPPLSDKHQKHCFQVFSAGRSSRTDFPRPLKISPPASDIDLE
jgi:hypothetical protein